MPRVFTVPSSLRAVECDGTDYDHEIRRFVRSGHLLPTDSAQPETPAVRTISRNEFVRGGAATQRVPPPEAQFLTTAVGRAFPPTPEFKTDVDVRAEYVCDFGFLGSELDPQDCFSRRDFSQRPKRAIAGPWIILRTLNHTWCPLGHALPHIEERHPGLGAWLSNAIRSPFTESPTQYVDIVGANWWQYEQDEKLVKMEYGDEYDGPTRAEFDKLYPQWAREYRKIARSTLRRNLTRAQRVLGVDLSGLFSDRGRDCQRFSWSHLWREIQFNYYSPFCFGWKDDDLVNAALDERMSLQHQSGDSSDIGGVILAYDTKEAAAKLAEVWRVLSTLDAFAVAIADYRKKNKV